jgi:hypothetical protein
LEPIKKVGNIPEVLTEMSVKDAKKPKSQKTRGKGKTEPAKGSRRKDKKKGQSRAEGKDMGFFFWLVASVFPTLAKRHQPPTTPCLYLASPTW